MYCAKCGAQNVEGGNYCHACGAALTAAVTPQPATYVPAKRTSGFAVASLVLGIIGLFFGILAILAIIFGGVGISQMGKNPELGGKGMAVAGLVLGIIGIVEWIIFLAVFGAFWGFINSAWVL